MELQRARPVGFFVSFAVVIKICLFSLFLFSLSAYSQVPVVDLQLTPGDHLLKAGKHYSTATVLSLISVGLSGLLVGGMLVAEPDEGRVTVLVSSSVVLLGVSIAFRISGHKQLKKAGVLMNQ